MIPKDCRRLVDRTGTFLLPPNECCMKEDWHVCYWLYIGIACGSARLQEPIKYPTRVWWHEVTKAAHYCLPADAVTKPMPVREEFPPCGAGLS